MSLPSAVGRLASRALDLALPARCAGCGLEGEALCPACLPALDERLKLPAGVPIGLPADLPEPLLQLEWCAGFRGPVRRALHELKYNSERRLAEPLGRAVARRWSSAGAGGDLVVPIPVHVDRLRRRGYDQAVLIAAVAGRELGLPVAPVLVRGQATIAQFDLDRSRRGRNVQGAFRATVPFDGRWAILIDDVTTTGATLAACADALIAAGALAVSALTIARER